MSIISFSMVIFMRKSTYIHHLGLATRGRFVDCSIHCMDLNNLADNGLLNFLPQLLIMGLYNPNLTIQSLPELRDVLLLSFWYMLMTSKLQATMWMQWIFSNSFWIVSSSLWILVHWSISLDLRWLELQKVSLYVRESIPWIFLLIQVCWLVNLQAHLWNHLQNSAILLVNQFQMCHSIED